MRRLSISPSLISRIKPVKSGFSLSPSSNDAREELLKAENGLFLPRAKLESATNWVPIIIPTVPAHIRTLEGRIKVTEPILTDEIERISNIRPSAVRLFGQNNPSTPHRTWMTFFSKLLWSGFRVIDESGLARPFNKHGPLEFFKWCNDYHPSRNCSRAPSC